MISTNLYPLLILLSFAFLTSCKSESGLTQRKYTDGHYHDFNFHREKSEKLNSTDSLSSDLEHPLLSKMKEELLPSIAEIKPNTTTSDYQEVLHNKCPLIADQWDSIAARQMIKDSLSHTDTMPECIETALSAQAMVGLGTVGGLVTIAAPQAIWFTFIPMLGIPFFLVISLIAGAIAFGKITRGEVDPKYKGAMRLWALCLVVNLILACLVLMHFAL